MKQELVVLTKDDLVGLIDECIAKAFDKMKESNKPKKFVSRKEAADQIGVSTWMIDKLCRSNKLVKHRIGNKPLIKQSDIDLLMSD